MIKEKSNAVTVHLVQELIQDLVNTGMSYARISRRIGFSPSTIQKIVKKDRMPRVKTIINLGQYYLKIFESPENYGVAVLSYFNQHEIRIQTNITSINNLLKNLAIMI